jgi:hypothetical protein
VTSTIVDPTIVRYSSLAIGTDGLAVIAYYDETNGDLKVAHCTNTECTALTTLAVDTNGNTGDYPSMTIGRDGFPLIAYYDVTNGDVKVAHCTLTGCPPYARAR